MLHAVGVSYTGQHIKVAKRLFSNIVYRGELRINRKRACVAPNGRQGELSETRFTHALSDTTNATHTPKDT